MKKCDGEMFRRYFIHMLESGIYLPPSQFETSFFGTSHGEEEIDFFLSTLRDFAGKEQRI